MHIRTFPLAGVDRLRNLQVLHEKPARIARHTRDQRGAPGIGKQGSVIVAGTQSRNRQRPDPIITAFVPGLCRLRLGLAEAGRALRQKLFAQGATGGPLFARRAQIVAIERGQRVAQLAHRGQQFGLFQQQLYRFRVDRLSAQHALLRVAELVRLPGSSGRVEGLIERFGLNRIERPAAALVLLRHLTRMLRPSAPHAPASALSEGWRALAAVNSRHAGP